MTKNQWWLIGAWNHYLTQYLNSNFWDFHLLASVPNSPNAHSYCAHLAQGTLVKVQLYAFGTRYTMYLFSIPSVLSANFRNVFKLEIIKFPVFNETAQPGPPNCLLSSPTALKLTHDTHNRSKKTQPKSSFGGSFGTSSDSKQVSLLVSVFPTQLSILTSPS